MKTLATRALRIVLMSAGILLAAALFAFGCEALQFGPFIPTSPTLAQPTYQVGFALLLACGATLFGVFKHFLD